MFSLSQDVKMMIEISRSMSLKFFAASLAIALVASLSDGAQKGKVPSIRGNVDAATKTGGGAMLDVAGWAADDRTGAPVQKVEVLLNDRVVAAAQLGLVRKDVAQTLHRNDFLRSGWSARIDLRKYLPGTYRLTARASNARGESGALAIARVEIRIP